MLWLSGRGQVASRAPDGRAQRLISIMADISERKAIEQRVQILLHEIAHRSCNLMAVVQAIAKGIGRSATWVVDFNLQFNRRLQALATSQIILMRQSWGAASRQDLIAGQLQPFVPDQSAAIEMSGPEFFLSIEATQNVGLAIHERATNALKHGAWSVRHGKVVVRWEIEELGSGLRRLARSLGMWRCTRSSRKPRREARTANTWRLDFAGPCAYPVRTA